MPIYEYKCVKCGNKFELLQKMSERNKNITCPKCGAQKTEKLFSSFSVTSNKGSSCDTGSCPTCPTCNL